MLDNALAGLVFLNGKDVVFDNKDDVIRKGAVIAIKHEAIQNPILNVIRKVEGSNIYFKMPEDFLKNNILNGDQLHCHILHKNYEYVIYGRISEIELKYPRLVTLEIEKTLKYKNNRKTRRYFVNLQAYVKLPDSEDRIYGIIKNISLSGFSVVLKEAIDESIKNINIVISIDEKNNVEFTGKMVRVVSKDMFNEYGVEITDLKEENRIILQNLVDKLERDEALFVQECLK